MGTWWQEAHLRVSFQARPSLARKARLRSAAFWTSAGTASAAGRRAARANRTAGAGRGLMTKLLLLGGFSRRGEVVGGRLLLLAVYPAQRRRPSHSPEREFGCWRS